MAKLTKTFVDKVQPPADGYAIHWDEKVPGYGLRITASGVRSFVAQGRVRGKAVIVTIGRYGLYSEDKARGLAQKTLQQMREGVDPRDVKREEVASKVTLQQVCDAYVGRPGKLKASSADEMKRHVAKVFTAWKDKPIASITRDMVRDRHADLVEKGLNGKKGAPASANASMVTLRILFNFAMDEYRRSDGKAIIDHNPVGALKHHWAKLGTRTERYIDKGRVGAVWNKLMEERASSRSRDALAGIDLTIFLLLTGARRDEAAALTWANVHIDDDPSKCWWHLEDRKRGDPIWLPLSSQAVALLKLRPRQTLPDGQELPFVFPSWGKTGRIMDARSAMETVSEIVGKHLSLHDLRRSFTNYAMRECRIEKFRTDMLTGHKPAQEDVTARNYLDLAHLDWLYPEVQQIGDWIEAQGRVAAAQANGENVVPLRA